MLFFHWVCAIVFYLLKRWGINYRMVLLEEDKVMGSFQSFFRSASILTTVFLALFLVYTLYRLDYIEGYDGIANMGYYMWLINFAYLLNPFKILNHHSRFFFLTLFKKFVLSPFNPMTPSIVFFTIMIGSFAQPFNDFIFTVSSIFNSEKSTC